MGEVEMKEYVDARILDLRTAIKDAIAPMDKRLDGMNEFRLSIKDLNSTLATKDEVKALTLQVQELRIMGGSAASKEAQLTKYIGWLIAAGALALQFFRK